ncbi:MAG: hypothetical protein JWO52_271 [Gammaproteobacteria bacterium]|nr:hypothetical protein [Gammaproteobacteria bacterium]
MLDGKCTAHGGNTRHPFQSPAGRPLVDRPRRGWNLQRCAVAGAPNLMWTNAELCDSF